MLAERNHKNLIQFLHYANEKRVHIVNLGGNGNGAPFSQIFYSPFSCLNFLLQLTRVSADKEKVYLTNGQRKVQVNKWFICNKFALFLI